MRLHPGHVEMESKTVATWSLPMMLGPAGCIMMLFTLNRKETASKPYKSIDVIIKDTDGCGKNAFMINGLTNLPCRLVLPFPIVPDNQTQLDAFLTDLNKKLAESQSQKAGLDALAMVRGST